MIDEKDRRFYAGVTRLYDTERARARDPQALWWLSEAKDLHIDVMAVADRIEKDLQGRRLEWLKYARLYSGRDFVGFGIGQHQRVRSRDARGGKAANRLTLNVIKSCVDTAQAKIASKKPRALFLTSGGDWELRERGKLATKYCDGLFDSTRIYAISQQVFTDSAVFGTGILKIFVEDEKVKCERVLIDELLVDEEDARYGTPSQMHQRLLVPRAKLLEMFGADGDVRKAILDASDAKDPVGKSVADHIRVVESWKLPSSATATDGRHTWCIAGCTLFTEPYSYPWFPFVTLRWSDALMGFFGIGLAEELLGIQVEINRVLRQISRAIDGCVPRAFIENGSKVNPGAMTDEHWSIVRYTGTPPTFSTPSALSPEVPQHLERLYSKAYEITGISQMSAQSKKEPGIDSGVALREMSDIGSERFLCTGQRFEDYFMAAANIMVCLTRDLAKKNPKLAIKVKDGKDSRDLKWLKDINLGEDQYLLRTFPVAFLPTTPAGRLAYIQDLIKTGLVNSKERILQLLDYPDLEEFLSIETIGLDHAQRCISKILNDGKYTPPSKHMNLELCVVLAQASVLRGEEDGRPQERLDLLDQWAEACAELAETLKPPAPAVPPAGPSPGGEAMGPPAMAA